MRVNGMLIAVLVMLSPACSYTIAENNIVIPRKGAEAMAGSTADGEWSVTPLAVPVADGVVIRGAKYSRPNAQATVLYFGGNGFVLEKNAQAVLDVYRAGNVDIVMFDHRGYGANRGRTSLAQLLADGVSLYDAVAVNDEVSRPLIVHGHSLGSFVAGQLASERKLDGLILEASATTTEEWVKSMAGMKRFLVRIKIEPELQGLGNLPHMAKLDEPTLFVVGANDETTKPALMRKLYDATALPSDQKTLLVVPARSHMDASQSPEFAAAFNTFQQQIGSGQ